ncbi:MAG: MFS transporter [Pirellulales bacterium]
MIRAATATEDPSTGEPSIEAPLPLEPPASIYGVHFWLCWAANSLVSAAGSLLYRYADFVTFLGGSELELGWIVGVGTVGGLAMRWWQASGLDHYGPRRVWLASLALFAIAAGAHVLVGRLAGPEIFLLRIVLSIALAGVFGSSIALVSGNVPLERMAEAIAMLGSSGFVGMATGPVLGDWILGKAEITRANLDLMFLVAALLSVTALVLAWVGAERRAGRLRRRRAPIVWLVTRYNPGWILLMAFAMGFGLGLPGTFLRTFTAELGIREMKVFFLVYTGTAFVFRIGSRRLTAQWGVRRMVALGMGALVVCLVSYLFVKTEAQLALPAVLTGIAHAVLFPAVVAGGSRAFPDRYRGLGTTIMLAAMDLGLLVGAPLVGGLLQYAELLGWPRYPTMFVTVAALLTVATCVYLSRDDDKVR